MQKESTQEVQAMGIWKHSRAEKKSKAQLEEILVKDVQSNKKGFDRYDSFKRTSEKSWVCC